MAVDLIMETLYPWTGTTVERVLNDSKALFYFLGRELFMNVFLHRPTVDKNGYVGVTRHCL